MSKLTDKQRAFVEAYLECGFNGAEAARRAGYSEKSIYSIASENLTKPKIREAIEQRLAEMTISADEVLFRLSEMAVADLGRYVAVKDDQFFLDWDAMKRDGKTHLVKEMRNTRDGMVVKLHDAQAALVHLGKHYRLFAELIEGAGEDGAILIKMDR